MSKQQQYLALSLCVLLAGGLASARAPAQEPALAWTFEDSRLVPISGELHVTYDGQPPSAER